MEKIINRDIYLSRLIDKKENGLIKVITGIRRCGKSYLLFYLFRDYLISSGVKEEQIISIALDDDICEQYRNPDELSKYIRSKIVNKETKRLERALEVNVKEDFYEEIRGVISGK